MIDEEATFEVYDYYPSVLKPYSHKSVLAACDECGKIRKMPKSGYHALCKVCARKGKHFTEDQKTNISASLIGREFTKEHKANISAAQKGNTNGLGNLFTEETKVLMSKNHADVRGEKNPNWHNGISFEPYCIKFNKEYKEHIRKLFGDECFLCSMSEVENGQALSVHHPSYNKQCGCDGTVCKCVPLCKRCHSKTNYNRDFWQALITEMLKPTEAWT